MNQGEQKMKGVTLYTGAVLILMTLFLLIPFATIWSINVLFVLEIEYTVWTWLAMSWLLIILGSLCTTASKKK